MGRELWWKIVDHWKVLAAVAAVAVIVAVAGVMFGGGSDTPAPSTTVAVAPPTTLYDDATLDAWRASDDTAPGCARALAEYDDAVAGELDDRATSRLLSSVRAACGTLERPAP